MCVRSCVQFGFKMFQAASMLLRSQHVSSQCFTVCTVLQETAQACVLHACLHGNCIHAVCLV